MRAKYYTFVYFYLDMLNHHVGCYFLPIIHCAGYIRLVADRLLWDGANAASSLMHVDDSCISLPQQCVNSAYSAFRRISCIKTTGWISVF